MCRVRLDRLRRTSSERSAALPFGWIFSERDELAEWGVAVVGCDDLMEPVLDEVVWLLRTSDLGFRLVINDIEAHGGPRPEATRPLGLLHSAVAGLLHRDAAFDDARAHLQRSFAILGEMVSTEGTAPQWPSVAASF